MERINFSKQDIGSELLPILTTGLYRDSLDALREYIQNAIDAQSTRVELSISPDLISITDNGNGMDEAVARQAIRLGISEKNPEKNIGFRGIGIYSAFNICSMLEVFTKSADSDTTYKLVFDFGLIRAEIEQERQRRVLGKPPELYLEKLLQETVSVESVDEEVIADHGTKVILTGILSESYIRLNDKEDVVDYLQNVVPLPFDPRFKFKTEIEEEFSEQDYRVVERFTLRLKGESTILYRPYTNALFTHGGRYPPVFFPVKRGNQRFGFAWICINDARTVLADKKLRGLLIKKFGFSIADRKFLEPYFGRVVYNRRITGELIIQHANLIPNAARNDFESNSTREAFLAAVFQLTREIDTWADNIQTRERAAEELSALTIELSQINETLAQIRRDVPRLLAVNAALAEIERRLKPHRSSLQKYDEQGLARTDKLLKGCKEFVSDSVSEGRQAARRAQETVQERVAKANQRKSLKPTDEDIAREDMPRTLISLLNAFDLLDSDNLRRALQYFDDNCLRANMDSQEYEDGLRDLRAFLRENV